MCLRYFITNWVIIHGGQNYIALKVHTTEKIISSEKVSRSKPLKVYLRNIDLNLSRMNCPISDKDI